jgi:hypothetical protein
MRTGCLLAAAAALLLALPASAQGLSSHYDAGVAREPDTQALAFFRIPFGESKQRATPRLGFGLFTDCSRLSSRLSSAHEAACASEPIRSFEVSRELYERDWLISFSGTRRWVGIARWRPGMGIARSGESGRILQGPLN